MATVAVITRPGKISVDDTSIVMDAVRTETHDLANTITDHPVEEGDNVSDHSRPEPDRVTMTCILTNTPLSTSDQTQKIRRGEYTISSVGQERGAIGTEGVAMASWKKLKDLRTKGTLVTVATTLGDYTTMGIVSISVPRAAKNYDGLEFTITFKKVRIVKNKLTQSVKSTDPASQRKKKAGAQATKEAEVKPGSLVYNGADQLGGVNNGVKAVGSLLSGGQ